MESKLSSSSDGDATQVTKEGYLLKMGYKVKSWKKRYFRIEGPHLAYYNSNTDNRCLGSIMLQGANLHAYSPEVFDRAHIFGVTPLGSKRTYLMVADNDTDRNYWLSAIKTAGKNRVELQKEKKIDAHSLKEGFLNKMGGSIKTWKRRYFVLQPDIIYYYANSWDPKPSGSIDLSKGASLSLELKGTYRNENLFAITPNGVKRKFMLQAADDVDRQEWMAAIRVFCNSANNQKEHKQGDSITRKPLEHWDLAAILDDSHCSQAFLSFAKLHFSDELVLFWQAASEYVQMCDRAKTDEDIDRCFLAGRDICERFILNNATNEINIANSARLEINKYFNDNPDSTLTLARTSSFHPHRQQEEEDDDEESNNGASSYEKARTMYILMTPEMRKTLFNPVQREVFKLMFTNLYRPFVDSKDFRSRFVVETDGDL